MKWGGRRQQGGGRSLVLTGASCHTAGAAAAAAASFTVHLQEAGSMRLLLVPLLAHLVSALHFHLPVNSVKCLKEEVDRDVLVTGEYELSAEPRATNNLKVGQL